MRDSFETHVAIFTLDIEISFESSFLKFAFVKIDRGNQGPSSSIIVVHVGQENVVPWIENASFRESGFIEDLFGVRVESDRDVMIGSLERPEGFVTSEVNLW